MDLSGHPRHIKCPHCDADITTGVNYYVGSFTRIMGLALTAVWCCCLPYCCGTTYKDAEHECPNCGRVVGTYRPRC